MIDKPILFSGPMVRAILTGQKTVTRRVLKQQPVRSIPHTETIEQEGCDPLDIHHPLGWRWKTGFAADSVGGVSQLANQWTCPIGNVADRLWVRETFQEFPALTEAPAGIGYRADLDHCGQVPVPFDGNHHRSTHHAPWTPSIHMPRRASRITLEITGVTAERLQDLTEEQAKAEGVKPLSCVAAEQRIIGDDARTHGTHPYTLAFAMLWDTLNFDRGFGWITNPWVWALSFRRITP